MMYKILPALALIAIAGIEMAYAENYTVEMTENGFSQTSLFIEDGDSVTFVNTHVKANGNIEPHAISDPFAVPYTELSYWILANSEVSHTYTLDCDGYTFYDRFFDVPSIEIHCGTAQRVSQSTIPTPIEPEPPITTAVLFFKFRKLLFFNCIFL